MLEGKEIEEINYEGTEIEKKGNQPWYKCFDCPRIHGRKHQRCQRSIAGKNDFLLHLSKAHARRVEEIFDSLYPEYKGELAKVLVSEDPRVYGKGGLLDQFVQ
jgi:type I restriction enzyme R subunit